MVIAKSDQDRTKKISEKCGLPIKNELFLKETMFSNKYCLQSPCSIEYSNSYCIHTYVGYIVPITVLMILIYQNTH